MLDDTRNWNGQEPLDRWLGGISFALMISERLTAVVIALLQDQLVAINETIARANVPEGYLEPIQVQSQLAIALSQVSVRHTDVVREIAAELAAELAGYLETVRGPQWVTMR